MANQTGGGRKQPDGDIRETSLRKWRGVIVQTAQDLWTSSVLSWAASLACYAVLSLFPLLIGSLVVASYVVDADWATRQATDLLGEFLPEGEAQIRQIVTDAIAERQRVGLLSFVLVLFTGRRILGGLVKALNHVSDVTDGDDTFKRKLTIELALLAGLIVLIGIALSSRRLVEGLWSTMAALPGPDGLAIQTVNASVRILLLFTIFALVYAYVPRGERLWRAVLIGAALATLLFVTAQLAFSLLVDSIWTNLTLIYGPQALAALLLTWAWYVSLVTLIGAGFASHVKVMILERQSDAQTSNDHTSIR